MQPPPLIPYLDDEESPGEPTANLVRSGRKQPQRFGFGSCGFSLFPFCRCYAVRHPTIGRFCHVYRPLQRCSPVIGRKLFVSATDADGAFTGRGMVSLKRALEVLDEFVAADAGGRAMFMVQSDHDGRLEVRHGRGGLVAIVTARAARTALLGGWLPAREAVVWRPETLDRDAAARLVTALYRLSGSAFRTQVGRELPQ